MSTYVGAAEAARILGVQRSTLYAYVSRGQLDRRTAVDGRTSLYDLDQVEQLAHRSRRAPTGPRPSIDVPIVSAITTLDEHDLRYRGHPVTELARSSTFEQVAELLWTGTLPTHPPGWPRPDAGDTDMVRRALAGLDRRADPLERLLVIAVALGAGHRDEPPIDAARRLLVHAPRAVATTARSDTTTGSDVDGVGAAGSGDGTDLATAMASALWPDTGTDTAPPQASFVTAVQRALVLLADHELATSTLAVRVATSVRSDSWAAFAAGLATLRGRLHGSAAADAHAVFDDALTTDARHALSRRLDAGASVAGFGHSVYRSQDPRFEVLLDAVRELPDPLGRMPVVDELLATAGNTLTVRPNVDLALAALAFVAGISPDAPLFAVARIAGWTAHMNEELAERPLRFRGLARATDQTTR